MIISLSEVSGKRITIDVLCSGCLGESQPGGHAAFHRRNAANSVAHYAKLYGMGKASFYELNEQTPHKFSYVYLTDYGYKTKVPK